MSSALLPEELQFMQNESDNDASRLAGRWTKDEHQRFVEALKLFGKNWKKVEEHVATRTGAQIRSHAQKFFNRIQKELNVNKGQAIENIANLDKVSQDGLSDDTTTKKRSFTEFIANTNNDWDSKYQSISANLKRGLNFKDSLDVDEKLNGLSKQIDSSILNIKDSPNDSIKSQKLAVWKDVITSIIGLTKQFVDELNTSGDYGNQNRVNYYKNFLGKLRSQ